MLNITSQDTCIESDQTAAKTRVLLYEAKSSSALFREALKKVLGNPEITGVSDFKGCSDIWLGSYLYDDKYDTGYFISEDTLSDIIERDRSLRNMDRNRSERIVRRLWNGIFQLFKKNDFNCALTLVADRCSIDIITRIADLLMIPIAAPVGTFVPGYALFTKRGERIDIRNDVSDEEASSVVKMITNKGFLPASEKKQKASRQAIAKWRCRRWLVENMYYRMKKLVESDPDNTYYSMSYLKRKGPKYLLDLGSQVDYLHIAELDFDIKNSVYIPLHLIPEATTDYWCNSVAKRGYERYILDAIESSDSSISFIIKEHPSMYKYGPRESSFYASLLNRPNTFLLHPFDSSNEVLSHLDNVLVSVGTVGIEALMSGKRVFALEDSYYADLHPNLIRVNAIHEEALNAPIEVFDNLIFAKRLLKGMFISDYLNDNHQDKCSVQQLSVGLDYLMKKWGMQ